MSWRAFCSHAVPNGAKVIFHPSEAHSHGIASWLRGNFSDIVNINPGWRMKVREVLTNNPHVVMTYANGHTRSVALYNATTDEVETAMRKLVEYGMDSAPRDSSQVLQYEPSIANYSPATQYVFYC